MNLMTNIVKVSYISLAKTSLRTTAGGPPQPQATTTQNPNSSMHQYPRNLRFQEPIIKRSKPVIHPSDHHASRSALNVINDEESVDRDAWDFIKKVHEKNLKEASEVSGLSEFVLPPPPHIMRHTV